MKRFILAMTMASLVSAMTPALAEDSVTAEEIIAKVRSAAAYLSKEGENGLANFNRASSDYVWKDSYVFVNNCESDVASAHPVAASRSAKISALRDVDGKAFGLELCKAAEIAGGSWEEYRWPRPVKGSETDELAYTGEPVRKVSYVLNVEGTPYQVGAGMFDDTTSLDQLNALISK